MMTEKLGKSSMNRFPAEHVRVLCCATSPSSTAWSQMACKRAVGAGRIHPPEASRASGGSNPLAARTSSFTPHRNCRRPGPVLLGTDQEVGGIRWSDLDVGPVSDNSRAGDGVLSPRDGRRSTFESALHGLDSPSRRASIRTTHQARRSSGTRAARLHAQEDRSTMRG